MGASVRSEQSDPECRAVSPSPVPVSIPEGVPCLLPAERGSQRLALSCRSSLSLFRACLHPQAKFGLGHGAEQGVPPRGCCDLLVSAVLLKRKQEADPQNPGARRRLAHS